MLEDDTLYWTDTKPREDSLRRRLKKAGYRLKKTPTRHWSRCWHGPGYMIIDDRNTVVAGAWQREYELTLEQAEAVADKFLSRIAA